MEALRRPAYEGFVEAVPDKGMFVSRVRFEDFIELYEIRLGMESIAARLCAARKTDDDIKQMEDILLYYEEELKKGNYLKAVQKDNEFHMVVIAGAKNSRMENMLRIVLEQCGRAVTLSASDPSRMETVIIPAHRKIFNAIVAGEPDRAEKAAREHILDVQEFFTKYQLKHIPLSSDFNRFCLLLKGSRSFPFHHFIPECMELSVKEISMRRNE